MRISMPTSIRVMIFRAGEWFKMPMQSGELHIMDVYQSHFTGKLVITVSCAVTDAKDNIVGVVSGDIQRGAAQTRAFAAARSGRGFG